MTDVEAAEPLLEESRSQYPVFRLPAGEEEIAEDESAMLPDLGVFHLSVKELNRIQEEFGSEYVSLRQQDEDDILSVHGDKRKSKTLLSTVLATMAITISILSVGLSVASSARVGQLERDPTSIQTSLMPAMGPSSADERIQVIFAGLPGKLDDQDWSYDNPSLWPGMCNTGVVQSPINIESSDAVDAPDDFTPISRRDFQVVGDELINDFSGRAVSHFDGHTITTDSVDSYFDWSGATFRLDQFNFHTPAEHTIDGTRPDAEVHFVHQTLEGNTLVVAALFKVGSTSPGFITEIVSKTDGKGKESVVDIDFWELLKEIGMHKDTDSGYYSYEGSLTTPPCTEGVQWVVLDQVVEVTKADLEFFKGVEGSNYRPVQESYGRMVYHKHGSKQAKGAGRAHSAEGGGPSAVQETTTISVSM